MAKAKKLVVAVFEKPDNCHNCPCIHTSDSPIVDDYCSLRLYNGFWNDEDNIVPYSASDPIPDWCPLTDVKFVPG